MSDSKEEVRRVAVVRNAFVIVTKWPTRQKSKTRLAKSIGDDLALNFVLAMLQDLIGYFDKEIDEYNENQLKSIQKGNNKLSIIEKFVLFTPSENKQDLLSLIEKTLATRSKEHANKTKNTNKSHKNKHTWHLLGMKNENLATSNLTDKLAGCVEDLKNPQKGLKINGSMTLIASDSLDIRMSHIIKGIEITTHDLHNKSKKKIGSNISDEKAFVIRAADGGYVQLSVPMVSKLDLKYSTKFFDNVHWSAEDTCDSQKLQLKKCGVNCIEFDEILMDVDEIKDWIVLCKKFGIDWNKMKMSNNKNSNDENDKKAMEIEDLKENEIKKEIMIDYQKCFPTVYTLLMNEVMSNAQLQGVY